MVPHATRMLLSVVFCVCVFYVAQAGVVTSSARIQALYQTENLLLQRLHNFITSERRLLQDIDDEESDEEEITEKQEFLDRLQKFYDLAWKNHSSETREGRVRTVQHPNGAFKTIQNFALNWDSLRANASREEGALADLLKFDSYPYADMTDYRAACAALVRLQGVYGLSAKDMMAGKYENYLGPPLSPADAYDIGSEALTLGYPDGAILWLQAALEAVDDVEDSTLNAASAYAKLGLAHITLRDWRAAERDLEKAEEIDDSDEDVFALSMRIRSHDDSGLSLYWAEHFGSFQAYTQWFRNFTRLCRRRTPVEILRKQHFCRYKCTRIPILRFKEMVVSFKPYASIFYDVISRAEADHIKQKAYDGLYQGRVGLSENRFDYQVRSSDVNFLPDKTSNTIARLSRRVTLITGLQTVSRQPIDFDSAEPFQTVNYGIGGHYAGHNDAFQNTEKPAYMHPNSDRMATFLLYLTEVERGGSTVFTSADIAVPPVEYGALFWYNYTPQGDLDELTIHAGCPVMIGEKWVANKWIWHYGNEFRRPCPLKRSQSQWSVEKLFHTTC